MPRIIKPILSIIAAIGRNRALGKNNKLLWHIPEDFTRFKKITMGHPIIMGRKTYESIGRPLPQRTNIIITKNKNYHVDNCITTDSLKEAIRIAQQNDDNEIFVIGGGQIYKQSIELADKLYLTIIDKKYNADTFFPDYSRFKKIIKKEDKKFKNLKYSFLEIII